ncbi:hypothetical protein LINPERHAP1_LOCUS84 [Linum perenne]
MVGRVERRRRGRRKKAEAADRRRSRKLGEDPNFVLFLSPLSQCLGALFYRKMKIGEQVLQFSCFF